MLDANGPVKEEVTDRRAFAEATTNRQSLCPIPGREVSIQPRNSHFDRLDTDVELVGDRGL